MSCSRPGPTVASAADDKSPGAATPGRQRAAWLFGATGLLGASLARLLHAEGYRLILTARSNDAVEELAASLSPERNEVHALIGDINSRPWLDTAVTDVAHWLGDGKLDALAFTTASSPEERRGHWSSGEDAFLRHWQLKCGSPLRVIDKALPMLEAAQGAVVLTGGIDRVVLPGAFVVSMVNACTTYAAAYLGRELAAKGVRVNSMSPGQFNDASGPTESAQGRVKISVPLGRIAVTEEISGVIAFLLSTRASYITASNVVVDGGLSTAV
jgi:NAD(P)-dependent dehydrogenase (short-subunit alcohol dehydrogenase family)